MLTCAWRREGSGDEEDDERERECAREREEPEDAEREEEPDEVDGAASGPPATRATGRWRPTRGDDVGESGADVGASGGGGWRRATGTTGRR